MTLIELKTKRSVSEKYFSEAIGYAKSRVSGSFNMSYYMHCRAASMPGQKEIFSIYTSRKVDYYETFNYHLLSNSFNRNNQSTMNRLASAHNIINIEKYLPYDDISLNVAILAAYKQIYGNLKPMENEKSIDLERRLRNGDITIRDFIRGIAKSSFYKSNYYENISQPIFIGLSCKHILGRPNRDQREISSFTEVLFNKGFDFYIDSLVDSNEYQESFGPHIVPFQRFWNSQSGAQTNDFLHTVQMEKGIASSDNALISSQKGTSLLMKKISSKW